MRVFDELFTHRHLFGNEAAYDVMKSRSMLNDFTSASDDMIGCEVHSF